MGYEIIITETASADIDEIAAFVFQASASQAITRKFINNIYEKIKMLADFPNSGSNPRNRALFVEGYKYLVFEQYLIFYRVENDVIYVSSVFNSKKDYYRYYNF